MERIVISTWVKQPQGRKMAQVVYHDKAGKGKKSSVTKHEVIK